MALDSVNCCCFKLLIRKFFASFHDAHNSCIEVVLSVSFDSGLGALGFLRLDGIDDEHRFTSKIMMRTNRFLRLDGVNVYLCSRIGEVGIEIEYILILYIFAHWSFFQYFLVPASQTL